ncbi:MAG: DNA repair protein RecN [Saprospirales bacterium]|nr:DNA repair protein RecN [Saprospirales bacterium]
MIRSLYIQNYAIIDELSIHFSDGLTIITGETGAGKSILLGALGLIMGKRADTKALYNEGEKCLVEGYFDVRSYDLKEFFRANDLDYDEEVILRREILPSGKSRAFINDTPVNLNLLQELSNALIDLHQQFDSHDIHNVSFQLRMLDALAANKPLLLEYQEHYRAFQADQHRLNELTLRDRNAAKESEFIQFQLKEFRDANLQTGEQEILEEELARLTNAEEIKRTLGAVFNYLSEDEQSVLGQLQQMVISVGGIRKYAASIGELHQRFQGLLYELQDLSKEFERQAEETEFDPQRIQEIQQRLDIIYRLQNKNQCPDVEALLELQRNLETQLQAFEDISGEIVRLQQKVAEAETRLQALAARLSERRKSVIPGFETQVQDMLSNLAMEYSRLQVEVRPMDHPGPTGMDEVNYLFTANKGGRLASIRDVASGGELSRLTLVTKSLVASAIPLPTLIFDEIDSGISGDVALKMGRILRSLSNQHQVVVITHSPQVASRADTHYFVYKQVRDDRTVTGVRLLSDDERVTSIATMLSQNPPSESAIRNAKELLAGY